MSALPVKSPDLSVIVPNLVGLHAAEPILRVLAKRGISTVIIAPQECRTRIDERMGDLNLRIIDYRSVFSRRRWAKIWHAGLTLALTPLSFSQSYAIRSVGSLVQHRLRTIRGATRVLLRFPKIRRESVNRTLQRLTRPVVSNVFPCQNLLCVTRIADAHVLCADGLHVTSLMESWDHPSKAPMGYPSDLVFVWNEALVNEWRRYQGDDDVRIGFPIKLAYAIAGSRPAIDGHTWRHKKLLYPATYSSYSASGLFEEELRLISELCATSARAGLKVHLKPKPNGRRGEFDRLVSTHPNLEIASESGASGPGDYFPTEEYNEARIALLDRCDAVVNLATTFALDSAALGLPVFQLEIVAPRTFPRISENFAFQHLGHLTAQAHLVYRVTDSISIDAALGPDVQARRADRAVKQAQHLRNWLCGPQWPVKVTLMEAAENLVDAMLAHQRALA